MKELVMSHEEILDAARRIGGELSRTLKSDERPPLFVCVLKGAANFTMDLIANVTVPLYLDFVQISSYEGAESTGKICLKKGLSDPDIKTDTVVIVEDIVDSGLSMSYLIEHLRNDIHPKRILVVTLLDKACARKVPVPIDFIGKTLTENKFVIGYGLDYNGLFRNVPYIYVPEEEIDEADALTKSA